MPKKKSAKKSILHKTIAKDTKASKEFWYLLAIVGAGFLFFLFSNLNN